MSEPHQGEIWWVQFDPVVGAEIRKTRLAVIVSRDGGSALALHLVVPLTTWQPQFARHRSKVRVPPSTANGLSTTSAADAMQLRSVSNHQFQTMLGVLEDNVVEQIRTAIIFVTATPS